MRRIDLTGQTIGDMHVDEYLGDKQYLCTCKCGEQEIIGTDSLKRGYRCKCTHTSNWLGLKFGEWTVIGIPKESMWLCRCSCGKEQLVRKYDLEHGMTTSCGHNRRQSLEGTQVGNWEILKYLGGKEYLCRNIISHEERSIPTYKLKEILDGKKQRLGSEVTFDLTEKQFGDWKALYYVGHNLWRCRCSCGTERDVNGFALRNNQSKSCGHATNGFKDLTNHQFGELHADKYLGNGIYKCTCSCGNTINVAAKSLREGKDSCGHLTAGKLSLIRNKRRTQEQVEAALSKEKLEEFIGSNKPSIMELSERLGLTYQHTVKICNKYQVHDLLSKRKQTYMEDELYNYITTLINPDKVERRNRTILEGKELDIYIPELKLAIEFNGTYWHSTLFKDRLYHQHKTIRCAQKGIRLIHIFEYEWTNTIARGKIEKYIKDIIIGTEKIQARHTKVEFISTSESAEFLEKYHLQGSISSSINIGLRYNDELVGIMTVGKPRFDKSSQCEIHRMVYADGISVIGGSQKMLTHLIRECNPSSIVTYADISKFTGNAYTRLGFKPVQPNPITEPGYVWVNPLDNNTLSRYQTQKAKLVKLGYDANSTEDEIMDELGYVKIYNSGNIKLEWK